MVFYFCVSPKNIEGGLINNYIKRFGAVMKGGTTVAEDILECAVHHWRKGV